MCRHKRSFAGLGVIVFGVGAMFMGQGCFLHPMHPVFWATDSSLELIQEASRRAKEKDPDAIVFQVQGLYGSTIPGPSLTLEYTFVATDPNNPQITWQLDYDRTTWTIKQINSPFVGAEYYDLTQVGMSFEQARDILLNANYTNDFHGWSLHKPLFGEPNPLYTFSYGTKTVTIDTVTEEIKETAGGPLAATPGEDSVSIQKIAEATAEIRKINPNAIVFWAGGKDGSGAPLNAVGDTNIWDFYAVDNVGSELKSWSLMYDGSWTVEALAVPPFGFEFWDIRQVAMDVVEAWGLAVAAGYAPPFDWWVVFKPLNPTTPDPVIIFGSSVGFIVVNTVSGEVTVE